VLRVNGSASVVTDLSVLAASAYQGRVPRSTLKVEVEEAFFHCGRAVKRARLWDAAAQVEPGTMPTIAEMVTAQLSEPSLDPEQARVEAETLY
jgi:predicted pyridoxine 5'-phosphate oxidase superfamily flavin-nucleotide-binding protein